MPGPTTTLPIPITGAAYQHPSQDTNYQRCINMYPTQPGPHGIGSEEQQTQSNPGGATLVRTPGLEVLQDFTGFQVRLIKTVYNNNSIVLAVIDNNVYKLNINPESVTIVTSELLGTISTTQGYVSISFNPGQAIIIDGSLNGYIYWFFTTGSATLGPIGGSSGDTYILDLNGVTIYNNIDVHVALTPTQVATQINLFTQLTGVSAVLDTSGLIITLQNSSDGDIVITEGGNNFLAGTDGITVTSGSFPAPNPGGSSATYTATAWQLITSPAFVGGSQVVYMDGYFIYCQPNSSNMWASQIDDGTSYNALDTAPANSEPDQIIGLAVYREELWAFCQTHVEIWSDTGNATGFPFSPLPGIGFDIGCMSPSSITEINNKLVWLDSRGFIVMSDTSNFFRATSTGYQTKTLSTPAQHAEWSTYPTMVDAIGSIYIDRGVEIFQIDFPSANRTWCCDIDGEGWFERLYYSIENGYQRCLVNTFCQINGLWMCGGPYSGTIYTQSHKYFTDAGAPIHCLRTTAPYITGFKRIGIDKLQIRMMTGAVPATGSGSNPHIVLRYSNNGGHTWSYEIKRSIGQIGDFYEKIIWNRLGTAEEWLFEFTITTPTDFSIINCFANVSEIETTD